MRSVPENITNNKERISLSLAAPISYGFCSSLFLTKTFFQSTGTSWSFSVFELQTLLRIKLMTNSQGFLLLKMRLRSLSLFLNPFSRWFVWRFFSVFFFQCLSALIYLIKLCKEGGHRVQGLPDGSFCESLVEGNLGKSSTDNAEDNFVFWILYFQHQIVWLRINDTGSQ